MRRICAIMLCLTLMLALQPFGAAEGFLVSDKEPAQSSSIWIKLFGKPEPESDGADDLSKAGDYAAHLEELYTGSIIDAVNGFAKLGKYRESVNLTAYCVAQLDYLRNDLRSAREGFAALGDFGDAEYRVMLCDAMSAHRIYKEGKFGFADINGVEIAAPAYDWVERVFSDESRAPEAEEREASLLPVAAVFNGTVEISDSDTLPLEGRYGLLRRDGELVAPVKYDAVLWAKDGVAALALGDKTELINIVTGVSIGGGFDEALEYAQGYIPVRRGEKWGYVDKNGEYLAGGLVWDDAKPFSEGYAAVMVDESYGFINMSGSIVIEPQYQNARAFGEGLAAVRINKRWAFIDETGEVIIGRAYQDAGVFSHGACAVKKNDKYGLIDRENYALTRFKYAEILPFDPVYHRAWIRTNKLWGLVSPDGTIVLAPEWGEITPFKANGLSLVSYKGKHAYIDTKGVMLIPSNYEVAAPFSAGHGGVINGKGQVEYLDRFSHGFTVGGNVPTEALCGFIEARNITSSVVIDEETGKQSNERHISYRLYEVDGTPITAWMK